MRILSTPIAAIIAIAGWACLATNAVEAQAQAPLNNEALEIHPEGVYLNQHQEIHDQKFEALNHGHKKNHHHHHHHPHHGKHGHKGHHRHHDHHHHRQKHHSGKDHSHHRHHGHHKDHSHHGHKKNSTTIGLVCDGFLVDRIVCVEAAACSVPAGIASYQQQAFRVLNNGGNGKPTGATRYITMQQPCSKDLPVSCSGDAKGSAASVDPSVDETESDEENSDEDVDGVDEDGFESTNNHGHKKKKHHGHHHHHKKPHKPKNKHPYQDRCVATGDLCGYALYGCDFEPLTLYTCTAIGEKPVLKEADSDVCKGIGPPAIIKPNSTCTCPDMSPICGSDLPAECKGDPNTIYHCPAGPGTPPVVLRMCHPGSLCKSDRAHEPICGFVNCECKGEGTVCGSQFADECKMDGTKVYKCTADGKAQEIATCPGTHECVSIADGAVCGRKDCKCSEDGTSCGEIFPISCRLSATSLYTCAKGAAPVVAQVCDPGRCTASIASLSAASAVFNSLAKDECLNECACTGKGLACGATFPLSCKTDNRTLYTCDGVKALPKVLQVCEQGCFVQADNDRCAANECGCIGAGLFCGSQLPEPCKAKADSLYKCSAAGAAPVLDTDCKSGKCIVDNGHDYCASDCTCPSTAPVCGFTIEKACGAVMKDINHNAVYHCPGGVGRLPQILKLCLPGTNCQRKQEPVGATCGGTTCKCGGNSDVCSHTFPEDCKTTPNSIYKCTASGEPQLLKTCESGTSCVTVQDGSVCAPSNCACAMDGDVCGENFPLECGIKATAIYTCIKGKAPTLKTACYPGRCSASVASFTAAAVFRSLASTDICLDSCLCADAGLVCGSTLPQHCNLDSGSLYTCAKKGDTPVLQLKCPNGICVVNPGDDSCGDGTECLCPDTDDVCGHAFPGKCGYNLESVHDCSGGAGTIPRPKKHCEPMECLIAVGNDACKEREGNPCMCVDSYRPCGSTFPASCNYDNHTLYKCPGGNGTVPVDGEKCVGVCLWNAGDDACPPPPPVDCKCRDNFDICGSGFLPKCELGPETLYHCTGAGTDPVKAVDCELGCQRDNSNDFCKKKPPVVTVDPCVCKDGTAPCGSTFPAVCGYEAQSLYQCPGGEGSKPKSPLNCTVGICLVKAGDDICPDPAPPVVDPCLCVDSTDPCGSTFPPQCGYLPQSLYQCPGGKGMKPSSPNPCTHGDCQVKDGNDQCPPAPPTTAGPAPTTAAPTPTAPAPTATPGPDPCLCIDDTDPCGSTFPESCGYDANSLFKCPGGAGTKPISPKKCTDGDCEVKAGHDQCPSPNPCLCKDNTRPCGSTFPDECGYDKNSLYKCPRGAGFPPVTPEECTTGECEVEDGDDQCKDPDPDPCLCKDGTKPCGSTFPEECGYKPNSLYRCSRGAGFKPTEPKDCEEGTCEVEEGDDQCTTEPRPNPCLCKDGTAPCGSTFPKECGFKADQLYSCSGGEGTPPVEPKECTNGACVVDKSDDFCPPAPPEECVCIGNKNICGSEFPDKCKFLPNSVYKCTAVGAKPTKVEDCTEHCEIRKEDDECFVDPCKCKTEFDTCGAAFPKECGRDPATLYNCSAGANMDPIKPYKCPTGVCVIVDLDHDGCQPPPPTDCKCRNNTNVCGSQFPPSCGFSNDTLHGCASKGATPVSIVICEHGCQIRPLDRIESSRPSTKAGGAADVGDFCKVAPPPPVDPCTCINKNDACSNSYPPSCNYTRFSLYKCPGGAGTKPILGEVCSTGRCLTEVGHDSCEPPPPTDCKCGPNMTFVCGARYPPKCNLIDSTLYLCSGNGTTPGNPKPCAKGCWIHVEGPDECVPIPPIVTVDPCVCQDGTAPCGSTFPAECNYEANSLYQCPSGAGSRPILPKPCIHGVCIVDDGDDVCPPPPPTDCKCKNNQDTCGSVFPESCKLKNETLYTCAGDNTDPQPKTDCTFGCRVRKDNTSDECIVPPVTLDCKCKDDTDACGSSFPKECNYPPSTLYKCTGGKGTDPSLPKKCPTGLCLIEPSHDVCQPPPPTDCKCRGGADICGKVFPAKCGFDNGTLYSCSGGKDTDPVKKEDCKLGCLLHDLDVPDECIKPNCNCTVPARICGDELNPDCKYDPNTVYDCTGGPGKTPVPLLQCMPGTVCLKHTDGSANCGGTTCNCTSTEGETACSNQFPDSCGLKANAVYKCTPAGTPKLVSECALSGTECAAAPSGASCAPTDCKCTEDGEVCGSTFPLSCSFFAQMVYTCTKGGTPTPTKLCLPGQCTESTALKGASSIFQAAVAGKCVGACECAGKGMMCAETFPPSCAFPKGTLYNCAGVQAAPAVAEKCADDKCTVTVTDDHCGPGVTKPPCFCTDELPKCGTELDPSCPAVLGSVDANSIYSCAGGVGEVPKLAEKCKDDHFCSPGPAPLGATCKPLCNCTGTETKCSKDFNPICKLPAEAIYKCGATGEPEQITLCNGTDVCLDITPTPVCTPPECICKDDTKHCGSRLPASCKLANNTLYQCKTGQLPTVAQECDPGICSATVVPAKAAGVDDFCIDKCQCKGTDPVCASTFDPTCGFKNKTLLNCDKVGAKPEENETCTLYCDEKDGADECKPDPCSCAKAGDTCGGTFPPKCGYDVHVLYKCDGKTKLPGAKTPCKGDELCVPVAGGNDICGPSNSCNCTGKAAPVCTDKFQPDCALASPLSVLDCPAGTKTSCTKGCAEGECKTDCKCTQDGDKCGSTFARECDLLPNTLYTCKTGEDPVPSKPCDDQPCVKGTSSDTCGDPCKCKGDTAVCATQFPDSCGLDKTSLYQCSAVGATPTLVSNCTAGCMFTLPDNSCKLDCMVPIKAVQDKVAEMKAAVATVSNPLTTLTFPALTELFDTALTAIDAAKEKADELAKLSGSLIKTTGAAIYVLTEIDSLANVTDLTKPVVNVLNQMPALLEALQKCTKSTGGDCSGPEKLYRKFIQISTDEITKRGASLNATLIAELMTKVKKHTDELDVALAAKDQVKINTASEAFSVLIGSTFVADDKYGTIHEPINLILIAYNGLIKCEGLEVVDKCKAYTVQLIAGLKELQGIVKSTFNLISTIGPSLNMPVRLHIEAVVKGLQDEAAGALNNAASTFTGLLQLFSVLPPSDSTKQFIRYTEGLVKLSNFLKECGGAQPICTYLNPFVQILGHRSATVLHLLLTGDDTEPQDILIKGLDPLIDSLKAAVDTQSLTDIRAAIKAFDPAMDSIKTIRNAGPQLEPIERYLAWNSKMVDCLDAEGKRPKLIAKPIASRP